MLSKRYESNKVDRRTWLHVPSGTHWSEHSAICIFNENKEKYNVKTSENDVKYSSFNMGEMDKSRGCTPEREITLADLKEKQCRGTHYEGQSKISESCQISHKLWNRTCWNLAY